jgi:hypothetical protein
MLNRNPHWVPLYKSFFYIISSNGGHFFRQSILLLSDMYNIGAQYIFLYFWFLEEKKKYNVSYFVSAVDWTFYFYFCVSPNYFVFPVGNIYYSKSFCVTQRNQKVLTCLVFPYSAFRWKKYVLPFYTLKFWK